MRTQRTPEQRAVIGRLTAGGSPPMVAGCCCARRISVSDCRVGERRALPAIAARRALSTTYQAPVSQRVNARAPGPADPNDLVCCEATPRWRCWWASARRAERGGDASVIVAGPWPARVVRNRGQANRQPPRPGACLRPKGSPNPQGAVFLPQASIPGQATAGDSQVPPAPRCDLDERLGYHMQVGGAVRTPSECLRTLSQRQPLLRPFCCQSPENLP